MTKLQKVVFLHFKKLYGNEQLPTYLINYRIFTSMVEAQLESRRTGIIIDERCD